MVRRVLVVVALLLAYLSFPAAATPEAPALSAGPVQVVTGQVRSLDDYRAAGLTLQQAVTVRLLDSLVAGGVPAEWVQPQATAVRAASGPLGAPCFFHINYRFDSALKDLPAGDLNGDRQPDVVVAYEAPAVKKATTHLSSLSFRDARTGRLHWSRTQRVSNDTFSFALPARLGSKAAPGVLQFTISFVNEGTPVQGSTEVTIGATAIDGRGLTLWRVEKSGEIRHWGTGFSYTNVPSQLVLEALRSGPEDLVISTVTGSSGGSFVMRGVVVGGDNGRERSAFSEVNGRTSLSALDPTGLVISSDPYLAFGVVPDQDGDRRPDLWTAAVGTPSQLRVVSGRTAKQVWVNDAVLLSAPLAVADAGVLVDPESNRHDLAITTGGDAFGFGVSVAGVKSPTVSLARVMLLKGGTGELQWVRFGDVSWPARGVYTSGRPALAVASVSQNRPTVPDGVPSPSSLGGVTLTADVVSYDLNGLPLAQRTYSWTRDLTACDLAVFRANQGVGDVDADGYADIELEFAFITFFDVKEEDVSQTQTVSGRTADVLRGSSKEYALGVPLDGRGADRLAFTSARLRVGLRAVSGDKGATLWSASRAVRQGATSWIGYALPVTSSRCSDTVFNVFEASSNPEAVRSTTQLLSSGGQPWWTLTFTGTRDALGRLTVARPPARRC